MMGGAPRYTSASPTLPDKPREERGEAAAAADPPKQEPVVTYLPKVPSPLGGEDTTAEPHLLTLLIPHTLLFLGVQSTYLPGERVTLTFLGVWVLLFHRE